MSKKIISILGPTSSGKTSLAVYFARKYNGEIVSVDSRQVYRGMDIGTGKDLDEYKVKIKSSNGKLKTINIPYHLIDIVSPKSNFNLSKYKKIASEKINSILERGKLPIIAGGSGLYAQALIEDYNFIDAKPNKRLREKLDKFDVNKLFNKLYELNPILAEKLNNSDKNNKRRLVRYIEIEKISAKGDKYKKNIANIGKYEYLLIGISCPRDILCKRIYNRLIKRIKKEDMIREVERLHKNGLSWRRMDDFGLEYRFISRYLCNKIEYDEMIEKLNIAIRQFAKRQMSWLRRWERQGAKIYWIKSRLEAEKIIKKFLK